MAKEIIDIYIEQGYEYPFNLDLNLFNGENLEYENDCYFECVSIGKKQFSVLNDYYTLTLSEADTGKLNNNLEPYTVYIQNTSTQKYEKLLSGRIHLDRKVKA